MFQIGVGPISEVKCTLARSWTDFESNQKHEKQKKCALTNGETHNGMAIA